MKSPLPLEICALIASYVPDERTLGALALTTRKLGPVIDKCRYTSPVVSSVKSFLELCDTITRRPAIAKYLSALVFDWKHDEERELVEELELELEMDAVVHQRRTALILCGGLDEVAFLSLPPVSFIEFLARIPEVFQAVSSVNFGSSSSVVEFDYASLTSSYFLPTLFIPMEHVSIIRFLSPVPRRHLRATMKAVGNGRTDRVDTLVIAVPQVDFGIMQELSLPPGRAKAEEEEANKLESDLIHTLTDLTIMGPLASDPYASNFLKDTPAALARLRSLTNLTFVVPSTSSHEVDRWHNSPDVFTAEQLFLDRLGPSTSISRIILPSGNEWKAWCDVRPGRDGMVNWEPAESDNCRMSNFLARSIWLDDKVYLLPPSAFVPISSSGHKKNDAETPLQQWWWSSDAAVQLVDIVPPMLLSTSRPAGVSAPVRWKKAAPPPRPRTPEYAFESSYEQDHDDWSSVRAPSPGMNLSVDVDPIVAEIPFDDDEEDAEGEEDEEEMRRIDTEAHAMLEAELGWAPSPPSTASVSLEMDLDLDLDHLERLSDGDSDVDVESEDDGDHGTRHFFSHNEEDDDEMPLRASTPIPPEPAQDIPELPKASFGSTRSKGVRSVRYLQRAEGVPSLFAEDLNDRVEGSDAVDEDGGLEEKDDPALRDSSNSPGSSRSSSPLSSPSSSQSLSSSSVSSQNSDSSPVAEEDIPLALKWPYDLNPARRRMRLVQ